jgi:hypothetical protein
MRRAVVWSAAVVVGVVVASSPLGAGAAGAAGRASPRALAATGPIVWGATVKASGKQAQIDAVHAFETKVGRKLGATRDFLNWDSPFPTSYENTLKSEGTTVLLSFSTRRLNGQAVKWATIAAATPGTALYDEMTSWADRIRSFGAPMYVTLQHEPEASGKEVFGTSADYIAAWRTWVGILRGEGAVNAKAMWITTAFAHKLGAGDRRQAVKWYPGDAYVDAIAVDAYNWTNCRPGVTNPWNSLQTLVEGFHQFWLAHPGPEVWLAEYASVEDPAVPGRRAAWLNDARALLQTADYTRIRGVVYFDLNKACDWRVDAPAATLATFAAMGQDPYFSG